MFVRLQADAQNSWCWQTFVEPQLLGSLSHIGYVSFILFLMSGLAPMDTDEMVLNRAQRAESLSEALSSKVVSHKVSRNDILCQR